MEKIGDISEPVVGSYGVHILQYVRDVPSGAVELDTCLLYTSFDCEDKQRIDAA